MVNSFAAVRHDMGKLVGVGIARGYLPEVLAIKDEIAVELVALGESLARARRAGGADDISIMAELEAEGFAGLGLEIRSLKLLQKRGYDRIHEAEAYNTLVNGGTNIMLLLLTGSGTAYTNAVAALGVGDSNAAFALTQTNLQGAVNVTDRIRKAMNSTFPSVANNVATWQSTFATTDANFTWNEWAIFNNVTDGSGTMLNRAVNNLGTKTSATAWQLTTTLTQN